MQHSDKAPTPDERRRRSVIATHGIGVKSSAGVWWPLRQMPVVLTAGRFFLGDRGFNVTYWQHRRMAVHLYEYHATMRLGGITLRLRPGDLTLSPPGVPTRYDLPQPGTHLCIHLAQAHPRAEHDPPGSATMLPLHLSLGERAEAAAVRIQRVADWFASAAGDPVATAAASAAAQELMLWLADLHRRPPDTTGSSAAERAAREVARLIDHNLRREASIPDLASAVGMSQNYLARAFRRHYRSTISRYRTLRRVGLARELLIGSDLSIKSVGARVGLPDPQHFNKVFRKITGMAPVTYRSRAGRDSRIRSP